MDTKLFIWFICLTTQFTFPKTVEADNFEGLFIIDYKYSDYYLANAPLWPVPFSDEAEGSEFCESLKKALIVVTSENVNNSFEELEDIHKSNTDYSFVHFTYKPYNLRGTLVFKCQFNNTVVYVLKMFDFHNHYNLLQQVNNEIKWSGVATKPFKMSVMENDNVLQSIQQIFTETSHPGLNVVEELQRHELDMWKLGVTIYRQFQTENEIRKVKINVTTAEMEVHYIENAENPSIKLKLHSDSEDEEYETNTGIKIITLVNYEINENDRNVVNFLFLPNPVSYWHSFVLILNDEGTITFIKQYRFF